ncbi:MULTISPECIES: nucleoside-diphosphate kinase [Bacillus cereus group]|uniref:Nucleoside diphosphate kinase-like domain-containing protein n=1 Tax=Bacillus proteolyticus TaxID=2026192 RepID=A0ABV3IFE7_9BACI|nr:nucleoside-diphosphate kinase [Bacillus cereus group sp. N8]MBJ8107560.1 hypothetical protein [Bacillus cereus group sp. N8]
MENYLLENCPKNKFDLYFNDIFFLEGYNSVLEEKLSTETLNNTALMVLKPDCIIANKQKIIFEYLNNNGYQIISINKINYHKHLIRSDWYYQINIASKERLLLVDKFLSFGPSYVVFLKRNEFKKTPATVELTSKKGSSIPELRNPGDIRYELGVVSAQLNFIHTADDPMDLIRSLGLYFGYKQRSKLIKNFNTSVTSVQNALDYIDADYKNIIKNELSFQKSLNNIVNQANKNSEIKDYLGFIPKSNAKNNFKEWMEFLYSEKLSHNSDLFWDLVTIISTIMPNNTEGKKPIL